MINASEEMDLKVLLILSIIAGLAAEDCTWPSVLMNSTWLDNTKGTLVFSTTDMSGYSVTAYSITLSDWLCLRRDTFASDGILLMKSNSTFNVFGLKWTAYLCLSFYQITEFSFYYYLLHGREQNAGQERVFIRQDENITSPDEICNFTSAATGSEFHVLIKHGFEENAKINCPEQLLGRFDFNITDADGTTYCDEENTTYHMNVCTDKTTISFDYPCERSVVYASENVSCVAMVKVENDTFLAVYNPESTVNNSQTYRFSCLAVSEDGLSATVVPHNCTDLQTSTVLAKDHEGNDIGAAISFRPLVFCKGACTWPSVFQSSTWRDNTRGVLTFTTTTMSGWSYSSYGSTISNWECLDTSYFTSDGILLLKATDTFSHVGSTWVSYLCLKMNKVTDYSYYYYQKHGQQSNAAEERVKIKDSDTLTTRDQICGSDTIPAAEFHFMVKSGFESSATRYCPPSLLKTMDYTYTATGASAVCDASEDDWDVCTDRKIMTFNYTACQQKIAYSASGTLWCMANITSTYEYVVVYNTDSSVSPPATYRFSCFVVSPAGTSASLVYNNCTSVQTPTSYATTHDGTSIGALLTMTAKVTCPFLGPDSGDDSPNLIPIIAGVIAGVVILAIIIAITVYCIKRKKSNGVGHDDKNVKGGKSSQMSNGTANPVTVKDAEEPPLLLQNPAFTAQPEKHTLEPLPVQTTIDESSQLSARHVEKLPPIKS